MNLVKIATACAVECERQGATEVSDLRNLLNAYERVLCFGSQMFEDGAGFARLAYDIEPRKNDPYTYRTTPVTFQNGGSSCDWRNIPSKMDQLIEAIEDYMKPATSVQDADQKPYPEQIVKQFLWIHPFADGNGRVGWLLLNYLLGTLDDPVPLPDLGW